MLPALENTPHGAAEWQHWSFDHKDSHDRIRQAIKAKFAIELTDYQIDPIDAQHPDQFMQNNSQLHGDMNGILRLESSDLQDANLQDEKELAAWIKLHYQEHIYAEAALGI